MIQFHHLGAVRAIQASKLWSIRQARPRSIGAARGGKTRRAVLRPAPAR